MSPGSSAFPEFILVFSYPLRGLKRMVEFGLQTLCHYRESDLFSAYNRLNIESSLFLIQREKSQDMDSSSKICNLWIKMSSIDDYIF